jgi:hypothetical protein
VNVMYAIMSLRKTINLNSVLPHVSSSISVDNFEISQDRPVLMKLDLNSFLGMSAYNAVLNLTCDASEVYFDPSSAKISPPDLSYTIIWSAQNDSFDVLFPELPLLKPVVFTVLVNITQPKINGTIAKITSFLTYQNLPIQPAIRQTIGKQVSLVLSGESLAAVPPVPVPAVPPPSFVQLISTPVGIAVAVIIPLVILAIAGIIVAMFLKFRVPRRNQN